jgi:hypothetical protein
MVIVKLVMFRGTFFLQDLFVVVVVVVILVLVSFVFKFVFDLVEVVVVVQFPGSRHATGLVWFRKKL